MAMVRTAICSHARKSKGIDLTCRESRKLSILHPKSHFLNEVPVPQIVSIAQLLSRSVSFQISIGLHLLIASKFVSLIWPKWMLPREALEKLSVKSTPIEVEKFGIFAW